MDILKLSFNRRRNVSNQPSLAKAPPPRFRDSLLGKKEIKNQWNVLKREHRGRRNALVRQARKAEQAMYKQLDKNRDEMARKYRLDEFQKTGDPRLKRSEKLYRKNIETIKKQMEKSHRENWHPSTGAQFIQEKKNYHAEKEKAPRQIRLQQRYPEQFKSDRAA